MVFRQYDLDMSIWDLNDNKIIIKLSISGLGIID